MQSHPNITFEIRRFSRPLQILLFAFVIAATGLPTYAEDKVDTRRNKDTTKEISRRQEIIERARENSARLRETRNEPNALNRREMLNKQPEFNKVEVRARDQAKLKDAAETLKKTESGGSAAGSRKAGEVGSKSESSSGPARGKVPGK